MRDRQKMKGRKESGTFSAIPHAVSDSPNWHQCSGTAIKMLCELTSQFNGRNNGDLAATFALLHPRGWASKETIFYAIRELLHYGLIVLTRQGGLHKPNLYALTWRAIDHCGGKLDCSPTKVASSAWKIHQTEKFKRPAKNSKPTTSSVLRLIRNA